MPGARYGKAQNEKGVNFFASEFLTETTDNLLWKDSIVFTVSNLKIGTYLTGNGTATTPFDWKGFTVQNSTGAGLGDNGKIIKAGVGTTFALSGGVLTVTVDLSNYIASSITLNGNNTKLILNGGWALQDGGAVKIASENNSTAYLYSNDNAVEYPALKAKSNKGGGDRLYLLLGTDNKIPVDYRIIASSTEIGEVKVNGGNLSVAGDGLLSWTGFEAQDAAGISLSTVIKTIQAGKNVTFSVTGDTLFISSSGGGGGSDARLPDIGINDGGLPLVAKVIDLAGTEVTFTVKVTEDSIIDTSDNQIAYTKDSGVTISTDGPLEGLYSLQYAGVNFASCLRGRLPVAIGTNDFTYRTWVKMPENGSAQIFSNRNGAQSSSTGFSFYYETDYNVWEMWSSSRVGLRELQVAKNLRDNQYHYIGLRRKAGVISVWVDGEKRCEKSYANNLTLLDFTIGDLSGGETYPSVCNLADMNMVAEALDDDIMAAVPIEIFSENTSLEYFILAPEETEIGDNPSVLIRDEKEGKLVSAKALIEKFAPKGGDSYLEDPALLDPNLSGNPVIFESVGGYDENIVFMAHFDYDFEDVSNSKEINNADITLTNTPTIDHINQKFGAGCLRVSNAGVNYKVGTVLNLENEPFTIDLELNIDSLGGVQRIISGGNNSDGAQNQWFFGLTDSRFNFGYQNGSYVETWVEAGVTPGVMNNIRLCRDAVGTVYFFTNGVLKGTWNIGTTAKINIGSYGFCIGFRYQDGSKIEFLSGYVDELCITKGVCKSTSDFTPPTSPVSPDGTAKYIVPAISEIEPNDETTLMGWQGKTPVKIPASSVVNSLLPNPTINDIGKVPMVVEQDGVLKLEYQDVDISGYSAILIDNVDEEHVARITGDSLVSFVRAPSGVFYDVTKMTWENGVTVIDLTRFLVFEGAATYEPGWYAYISAGGGGGSGSGGIAAFTTGDADTALGTVPIRTVTVNDEGVTAWNSDEIIAFYTLKEPESE